MIKIRLEGTRKDLKGFIRWFNRASVTLPKYELKNPSEFMESSNESKEGKKYVLWFGNLYVKEKKE